LKKAETKRPRERHDHSPVPDAATWPNNNAYTY